MLKINEIAEIMKRMDLLYHNYRNSYSGLKSTVFNNAASVKYSSGGLIYPFGKYFFGQSKLYKKQAKKSPGHFCKTLEEANFAYVFSEDGRLLAFNQFYEDTPKSDGYVDKTGFFIYDEGYTYILKFDEHFDPPILREAGIIYSRDNYEIMVHSDIPCKFVDIIVSDKEKNNEYSYYFSREIFRAKYDPASQEEYPIYSTLN